MSHDPRVLRGLRDIHERRWFEAHEELELAWREAQGERRQFLQGLIQGAVALEHLRRGNPRGARGQWDKARAKLAPLPAELDGVYIGAWIQALDAFYAAIDLEERSRRHVAREPMDGLPTLPPVERWPLPEYEAELLVAMAKEAPHPEGAGAASRSGHG